MKSNFFAVASVGAIAVMAAVVGAQGQQTKPRGAAGQVTATAEIKGKGITGTAELTERADGTGKLVEISVKASGLTPGRHGIHIHAIGKCEEPDFTSAGGHFDPGPAGNTDPDANHPFHMGDIPNIEIGGNGSGSTKIVTSRVTLSDGPLTVFDSDGTAIVIHANEDQWITGAPKSGVSGGPRLACGVLTKK